MEWNYKNVKIRIESDGCFYFSHKGKADVAYTLNDAKRKIDEITESYYTFSDKDVNRILKKLDEREQDFVSQLLEELKLHSNNAYCSIGISDDFLFNLQ